MMLTTRRSTFESQSAEAGPAVARPANEPTKLSATNGQASQATTPTSATISASASPATANSTEGFEQSSGELVYGSLFSGYEGLTLGCQQVLPGRTAWFCEIEPAPSRVLAHHWPDVPNLGDITTVDFRAVEPIDVLTGGFPCQDVSHAGKRAGLTGTSRSGL